MSLASNLRIMERAREAYFRSYPGTSPVKLRWRAAAVRHGLHVIPGERVLELGAGSGLWTRELSRAFRGESPITAAVFDPHLAAEAREAVGPDVDVVLVDDLLRDLPEGSFDHVVGTAILCHDRYFENLAAIRRLLRPRGQMVFFEANLWNPQVLAKGIIPGLGRFSGQAACQVGLRRWRLLHAASRAGFVGIDVSPFDIVHPRTPSAFIRIVQALGFILEHAPILREFCGTLSIWAARPDEGESPARAVPLDEHASLHDAVSVVVPAHDEEMNVAPLAAALLAYYGRYLKEIVFVDDNSTDRTAEAVATLAAREPRIKLVRRTPPGGVGHALRDGYAAATGRFVLSMDCDFVDLVPELRDLFDAVAAGADGAVGSRFSYDSMLVNYPFFKILCNRAFHLAANAVAPRPLRDVTNNLKLYRAEVIRALDLREPHFAANAETGLQPIFQGWRIVEVPVSWINRTEAMGSSSFRIAKVAPDYLGVLFRVLWRAMRSGRGPRGPEAPAHACPVCEGRDVRVKFAGKDVTLRSAQIGSSRGATDPGEVLRCRGCGFGFRSAVPDDAALATLYRDMDVSVYESEDVGRDRTARVEAAILDRFASGERRLLDVGCASGRLLAAAAQRGWSVTGLEPSPILAGEARQRLGDGARVIEGTLQEASLEGESFEAVTLWDVLEHVADPKAFLELCARLLAPGGVLIANVPNLDSIPARILGARWPLLLPEHLGYHTRSSLRRSGEAAGLVLERTGRRWARFSCGYVLQRLGEHRLGGAFCRWLGRRRWLRKLVVPVPLGEVYGVWRKP